MTTPSVFAAWYAAVLRTALLGFKVWREVQARKQ